MGIEDFANEAKDFAENNDQLKGALDNEHVQGVLNHLNPDEVKNVLQSDQVQNVVKGNKVEEVSDKIFHAIADAANKVTGGKYETKINEIRDNLDAKIGNDGQQQ